MEHFIVRKMKLNLKMVTGGQEMIQMQFINVLYVQVVVKQKIQKAEVIAIKGIQGQCVDIVIHKLRYGTLII